MTRAEHVNSYHMTRAQAERIASGDRSYVVRPYPDRHGSAENNFTPDLTTWGVWSSAADHWVFVHTVYFDVQQVEGSVPYRPAGSGYAWE